MAEYIDREAAIEAVKHAWAKGLEPSQYIEIIPAADVEPARHGRSLEARKYEKICAMCGEKYMGYSRTCQRCNSKEGPPCKYNGNVTCGANRMIACPRCGWNPDMEKKRKLQASSLLSYRAKKQG